MRVHHFFKYFPLEKLAFNLRGLKYEEHGTCSCVARIKLSINIYLSELSLITSKLVPSFYLNDSQMTIDKKLISLISESEVQ